ncbi:MAG: tRNA uridine-5-carboxymethylaminomethyl(34) synthesis GTPase MnmE [Candidatus Marinimicrobia bacterium]|nr:tRNA uridine-5-carboxymethylaminomethyl(34) synthesis GTPase MnmE [Candidatus Neomarinimicrobiota bacterium]
MLSPVEDTIIAAATPPGEGGISVLRISGEKALGSLLLATKKQKKDFLPRKSVLCFIYNNKDEKIDSCLAVFYLGPNSYTGENVVEVSCHGSPIVLSGILDVFLSFSIRLAEPGEFTKRAFLNGKMDLSQAESVSLLISSKSSKSAKIYAKAMSGEVSSKLNVLYNDILTSISYCEYELDVSEGDEDTKNSLFIIKTITNAISYCTKIFDEFNKNKYLFSGATVSIAGKPNVGKSTLFNYLVGKNRSITNHKPGTTRDYIEQDILINAVPVRLVDTAGDRNALDDVEQEGIRRSHNIVKNSDLVLRIHDVVDNIEHREQELQVLNKIDINNVGPFDNKENKAVMVSAKTGAGIPALLDSISSSLLCGSEPSENSVITNKRQANCIKKCSDGLSSSLALLNHPVIAYELVSLELRDALGHLDILFGKTTTDKILNHVFNNFCVGK